LTIEYDALLGGNAIRDTGCYRRTVEPAHSPRPDSLKNFFFAFLISAISEISV